MAQCTATSKRSGERCRRAACVGTTVCAIHGGKTPRGLAAPSFVHGRYSKYLPGNLLDRYRTALDDGELLALRDDIALLDTRLSQLVERIPAGESSGRWGQLATTWRAWQLAISADNVQAALDARAEIDALITSGANEAATWSEIGSLLQQRVRLVESERKRLIDMQQTVTVERALVFVSALMESVKRHVHDRAALAAISADLGRLLTGSAGSDRSDHPAATSA